MQNNLSLEYNSESSEMNTSIVSPVSGLANDYLNVFNEVLLMIENLPVMPEMLEEMHIWTPISYQQYFEQSKLAESQMALHSYMNLDKKIKDDFDRIINDMKEMTHNVITQLDKENDETLDLDRFCSFASRALRIKIDEATYYINHGQLKYKAKQL